MSILLVEDHIDTQRLLALALQTAGFECIAVDSAEEALEIIESGRSIRLIISDLGLPGIGGEEFIRTVRANGGSAIPVIIFSGSLTVMRVAARLGAIAGIEKGSADAGEQIVNLVRAYAQ